MRPARAFIVPYDSGHRDTRMGAGPLRLREELQNVPCEVIESAAEFRAEVQTTFELYRALATRVRSAVEGRELPIVLAGNCGACIGTAAGVGVEDLAVIWFDAHGDFMTPETTVSGFLDGMGMSILAGLSWRKLAATIPHFEPVSADRLVHVGGRAFSDGEEDAFAAARVALVTASSIREKGVGVVNATLDAIASRAKRIVVHVDMDVLDPQFGAANNYAAPGGLSPDQVREIITACGERFEIAAIEIASFDPSFDHTGTVAEAAMSFVEIARGC